MMQPATGIESATCGLRISDSPTSDKLSPQETTIQGTAQVAADGGDLSCPGSSMVANTEGKAARFENPPAPETIGHDRPSSTQSRSLIEEQEVGEEPMEIDRTR